MNEKVIIRIAVVLAVLLGLWALLGGAVPFVKAKHFSPSDDMPTFEAINPDDVDDRDYSSGTDRNDEREFVGDEYDPDRERKIDEMIEDAKERDEEDRDDR